MKRCATSSGLCIASVNPKISCRIKSPGIDINPSTMQVKWREALKSFRRFDTPGFCPFAFAPHPSWAPCVPGRCPDRCAQRNGPAQNEPFYFQKQAVTGPVLWRSSFLGWCQLQPSGWFFSHPWRFLLLSFLISQPSTVCCAPRPYHPAQFPHQIGA